MTKRQVMKRVRSMMHETRKSILHEADRLLSSGAIDYENEPNDFRVPKLLLSAAMRHAAQDWEPLSWNKSDRQLLKNLSRF